MHKRGSISAEGEPKYGKTNNLTITTYDMLSNCQDTASVFLASGDPKLLTSVKGCGLRTDILGILMVGTHITAVSIHNPINHTG